VRRMLWRVARRMSTALSVVATNLAGALLLPQLQVQVRTVSISSEIRARHDCPETWWEGGSKRSIPVEVCGCCNQKVPCDAIRAADELAAAEKLAQAVEDYCAADGNEFGEHAWWPEWKEMWSALAHYRELCPVTAQDARQ